MKSSSLFSCFALLVSAVAGLYCELPTDPATDPENAYARLVIENGGSMHVNQGESRTVGLYLRYPLHFEKITITSSCGVLDTVISFDTAKSYDTMYFSPVFTNSGECVITATAFFLNKKLQEQTARLEFYVKAGAPAVEFVHTPASLITHTGNSDTLLFVTKTRGNAVAQEYTVASEPPIDPAQLYLLPVASNDTARIVFNPASTDSFTVSVTAIAQVPAAAPVTATAAVGIRVFSDITPSFDAPQNIIAGTADTLRFAVDNSTRSDKLTISLVTDNPLDPAIFTVLPSNADSVVIATAATTTSTAGTAKIGIVTGNGIIFDTTWYPVTFIDKESALWNQTELALPATEGAQLRYDLKPLLFKPQSGSVTFSADPGTVTPDTFWQYTPAYGSAATVNAVVTAQKGSASFGLSMIISVAPGDTTAPAVSLADPALNGRKVSTPQITVNCNVTDMEAGVAAVVYSYAGKTVAATAQTDKVWSGVVSGLENGKATEVTITATDKSMMKNSASIKFSVTFDSTTPGVAPQITTDLPATVNVIEGEALTLKIAASGMPTPTYQWYKDNVVQAGQTGAEYRKNKAAASDSGSYSVVVSNGIGADATSTKAVVAIRLKAHVTQDPVATTVNEGSTGSFIVTAVGEAPLSFKWYKSGELIADATNATCSITGADVADNGKTFTCIVSNAFSSDTSSAAVLTVTSKPVYTVSFNAGEGVTSPANQQVAEGGKVTQPKAPEKNGSTFSGWYKDAAATTLWDFAADVVNGPLTLYAKWAAMPSYSITFNGNGGTGAMADQSIVSGLSAPLTANAFTKTGATFAGWATTAAGTTIEYADRANYTMGEGNVTLFALWKTIRYTLTYNGNSNGSGSAPAAVEYDSNTTIIIADNTGNLTRAGFTFNGWNTLAAGNGTPYAVNSSLVINTNTTLYAQWSVKKFNITYLGNGNTGGSVPAVATRDSNTTVTVATNSGTLTKTGYDFAGWNTAANGSGTSYAAGTGSLVIKRDTTLYAAWTIKQYTVTYDGNNHTNGTVPDGGTYDTNTTVTVASNSGSLVRTGYTFGGWNTNAGGTGTNYTAGTGTFPIRATTILYAKWNAIPTYSLTYTANGATGTAPSGGNYQSNTDVTVVSYGSLVKNKFIFDSWNTQADGKGTTYAVNATITIGTSNITLYARWKPSGMVRVTAGTFQMGQTGVTGATPVHEVTLTKNFWMDNTEVTQTDFSDVITAVYGSELSLPDWTKGTGQRVPAYNISWAMAILYCNGKTKLSGSMDTVYSYSTRSGSTLEGITIDVGKDGFRLPTEAEWEYACRAGSTTLYYWGNSSANIGTYAWWTGDESSNLGSVASFTPNNWNLYDMIGSVAEWVNDRGNNSYTAGAQTDPLILTNASYSARVIRGGSVFSYSETDVTCASRESQLDYYGEAKCGFRVAMNAQW